MILHICSYHATFLPLDHIALCPYHTNSFPLWSYMPYAGILSAPVRTSVTFLLTGPGDSPHPVVAIDNGSGDLCGTAPVGCGLGWSGLWSGL